MTPSIPSNALLLGFPEYSAPAQRLAQALGCAYAQAEIHRFPDDESLVRIPEAPPEHVILCRSLDRPNDKLIELMLAAETARAAGAESLTLIAPYLCYMRQDHAFRPGEAVSQHIVGRWLAELFDAVITVDPHLHRVAELGEVLPARRVATLNAGPLLAAFLHQRLGRAFLIGPDSESRQWVEEIAERAGMDYLIGEKQRLSDKEVRIKLPPANLRGKTVVIVDDVASTARTLSITAQHLRAAGVAEIHCCVTHALFAGDAEETLRKAGINHVWSTDSVLHSSNAVELAGILAAAVTG